MALVGLFCIVCVVAINTLAPRIRISAPLLLVIVGIAVAMQPVIECPVIPIEPEWILAGVLPLLLFAAAVSMPVMNFRRNLPTIAGLSVTLVVLSSLALGALCQYFLPELGFAGGVALGAILSPTDAVATSIVKRLGVAPRVVALLDGEAMLNDASALVLLRAALAATASSVSVTSIAGKFALSIVVATLIGGGVGWVSLHLRKRIEQTTANTLLSFAVPFFAFQPAEHLGASGLVAVVAAGLVVGQGSPYVLPASHRIAEEINWRTIEMLLEGALFLMMGLELFRLLRDVRATEVGGHGVGFAIMLAAAALGTTLVVRTLVVVPLLWGVRHRQHKYERFKPKLEDWQHDLDAGSSDSLPKRQARHIDGFKKRVRRALADVAYVSARPLGTKDGVLLVWAGMRGAITLAAAETLPESFPHRSLVILVAFLVASSSLLLQGGSVAWVIRRLKFPPADEALVAKERHAIFEEVEAAAMVVLDDPELRAPDGTPYPADRLAMLRSRISQTDRAAGDERPARAMDSLLTKVFDAQRRRILDARADGLYSSEALEAALEQIDTLQLGFQLASAGMRGGPE